MVGYRRSYAKKRDENEATIVDAMRRLGAKVYLLDGKAGIPDLLVGWQGRTTLIEVKMDGKPAGGRQHNARKLRDGLDQDQFDFHRGWNGGPCVVVTSVDEAIAALRAPTKREG